MPADPRALAQEAIELARERDSRPSDERVISDVNLRNHASVHYGEIARALIEALDERDRLGGELAAWGDVAHTVSRERDAVTADRDALLADLPHALGKCDCVPLVQNRINVFGNDLWPEAHTAAIARLEARIK